MAAAGAHAPCDRIADLGLDRGAVEKRDMLRPGQPDQHLEAGLLGGIEQPDRRHGEYPNGIDAGIAHQREIALDNLHFRELSAMAAGAEGTVRHALDEMLDIASKKELAADPDLAQPYRGSVGESGIGRRRLHRRAVAVDRAHLASSRAAWHADRMKIVGCCVIGEFICHFSSTTKRLAEIMLPLGMP